MANPPVVPVEVSKANRTIGIAIAAIVAVFAVFTYALWRAHFFTYTGSETSSKLAAEALTFVGGLVAAVVSILGVLLKYSMDRQTEARLTGDSVRSATQKEQEEKRLKLEAGTRVIQLFGTSDGKEAPDIQIAGGLLTLASLGQHSLTLVLTGDLLRRKKLAASTACLLIDQALQQDSEDIQISAMDLLSDHAADLLPEDGFEFPMAILNWGNTLSPYAREWAPIALGITMAARPLTIWRTRVRDRANSVVAALSLGWLDESDTRLKNETGVILSCLLRAFPDSGILYHPRKTVDTDQIKTQIAALQPTTESVTDVVARLNAWITEADGNAAGAAAETAPPGEAA